MNQLFETPAEITFHVEGIPAPQGSKQAFAVRKKNRATGQMEYTGKTTMKESAHDKVQAWRTRVHAAAEQIMAATGWTPPASGAIVDIDFYLPRPKGHYRTGRYAGLLRDAAPTAHTVKPDRDKLERSTHDALTSSGIINDDANIVGGSVWKHYADGRPTGARITIRDFARLATDTDQDTE